MKDLIIKKTRVTPEVNFKKNGELYLEGVSLPEDAGKFYFSLITFIESLNCDNIQLTIKLGYLNTASSKQIYLILRSLENKSNQSNIIIEWAYPEDDEDIFDSGKHYASLISGLNFSFVTYVDA